jgi:hypothetical protein
VFHAVDVAELFNRYADLLRVDGRKNPQKPLGPPLSPGDRAVAVAEAKELWSVLHLPDETGALERWFREVPDRHTWAAGAVKTAVNIPETREITGATFERRPNGVQALVSLAPRTGLLVGLLAATEGELREQQAVRQAHAEARLRAEQARHAHRRAPSTRAGVGLEHGLGR